MEQNSAHNTIRVVLGERSYDICTGKNWLSDLPAFLQDIPKSSKMLLVSDKIVFSLYGPKCINILRDAGFSVEAAIIEGGEECKNLSTVACLYNEMLSCGLDRQSVVLALGGGIVGDTAGFAAATYMRGTGYIQIPTTLLAQTDSSVGGKTGVNLEQGKNLVGSFYQPSLVFIDVDFMDTLPEKEYLSGLAEVIKYGIIWDNDFFTFLESNIKKIKSRNKDCLLHIISRCCTIKAEIVGADEKEKGARALLNLGHTFGHAFESLTAYRKFTHGEAVAIGTIYAANLARSIFLLNDNDADRIINLIKNYGLPSSYGNLDKEDIIKQMYKDKKNIGGKLQLVLPDAIGSSHIVSNLSDEAIKAIL